jgi:hypothetical protein
MQELRRGRLLLDGGPYAIRSGSKSLRQADDVLARVGQHRPMTLRDAVGGRWLQSRRLSVDDAYTAWLNAMAPAL